MLKKLKMLVATDFSAGSRIAVEKGNAAEAINHYPWGIILVAAEDFSYAPCSLLVVR